MAFNVWSIKMPRIQYVLLVASDMHACRSRQATNFYSPLSLTFMDFYQHFQCSFSVRGNSLCIASTPDEKVMKIFSMQDCFNYCMFSADFLVSFLLRQLVNPISDYHLYTQAVNFMLRTVCFCTRTRTELFNLSCSYNLWHIHDDLII